MEHAIFQKSNRGCGAQITLEWTYLYPRAVALCLLLPSAVGAPDDVKPFIDHRLMLYQRAQIPAGAYRANQITNLIAFRVLLRNQLKEPLLMPDNNVNLRLLGADLPHDISEVVGALKDEATIVSHQRRKRGIVQHQGN